MSGKKLHTGFAAIIVILFMVFPAKAESPLTPSPLIQEIVETISADSFYANISQLEGFLTRNTVSDTLSDITGIGAARRWVFSRFAGFSARSRGALIPGYFDFNDTVCDIAGKHRNVMATLPGSVHPDRYFVVGAHIDSRGLDRCDPEEFAPAANDDGSGVAAIIELARVMSRYTFDNSVIFMIFTGEEQGLLGSKAYSDYCDSLDIDIRGMFNLDMLCSIENPQGQIDSTSFRVYSRGQTGSSHRQLARLSKLVGEMYVPVLECLIQNREDRIGRGGDHMSFGRNGFTSVRYMETNENRDRQHNDQDLIEYCDTDYGIKIVRYTAAMLANMALAPERPESPRLALNLDGSYLLSWPRSNPETDLAGYLVAIRALPGAGLFLEETMYKEVVDVGDVNRASQFNRWGVKEYAISVAAYDTLGTISLFSEEVGTLFRRDLFESEEIIE
jgi:hypothetical protein